MIADDFIALALWSLARGEDRKHTNLSLARQLSDNGIELEYALTIGRCNYLPYVPRWASANCPAENATLTKEWEEAVRAAYSETLPAELPDQRADSSPLIESPPLGPTPATTLDPDSGSDSVPSALSGTPEPSSPAESTAVSENIPTSGVMPDARLRDLNIDRQAEIEA